MESFKYALVLFDHDGYTDVVECKRLKTDKPVAQALQAELWWGSKLHKVEVLMVACKLLSKIILGKISSEHKAYWYTPNLAFSVDYSGCLIKNKPFMKYEKYPTYGMKAQVN